MGMFWCVVVVLVVVGFELLWKCGCFYYVVVVGFFVVGVCGVGILG